MLAGRRLERAISRGFLLKGSNVLAAGGGFIVVILALVTFVGVTGRYSPWAGGWLAGGVELSELLMATVSVLAWGYCWHLGGHIRIDFLKAKYSPRINGIMDAFSAFVAVLWCGSITWRVLLRAITDINVGLKTMSGVIPVAPFEIIFVIAVAHFTLVLLRSGIGSLAKAIKGDVK